MPIPFALDDTIVAVATPSGSGGIGIVRLSGPEATAIATEVFAPAAHPHLPVLRPYRLRYGHVVDPADGRVLDEVLVSYMPRPHSYTREDVVEINAHGGPIPLRAILALCLRLGARQARAGEFTLRAFLNGRLDLAQAEAVLDVVQARTDVALGQAVDQLGGALSEQVRQTRGLLLTVLAGLEVAIDHPDEDLPEEDPSSGLAESRRQLEWLITEAERGLIYRQGVRVAIIGRPNVGKSSLLNRLLRADRAIVTEVPGTTRDTLEETIDLGGIPFVLTDTAGIGETVDPVEQLGIGRSYQALNLADLALLVVDGSVPQTSADQALAARLAGRGAIVVMNKSDLPAAGASALSNAPHVRVSALTGEGLADLEEAMVALALGDARVNAQEGGASSPRHRDQLMRALEAVHAAEESFAAAAPTEIVAIDVGEAVDALGEITGETASEDLLATIFSRFCIGK
jgi:tRNA modification GTPase